MKKQAKCQNVIQNVYLEDKQSICFETRRRNWNIKKQTIVCALKFQIRIILHSRFDFTYEVFRTTFWSIFSIHFLSMIHFLSVFGPWSIFDPFLVHFPFLIPFYPFLIQKNDTNVVCALKILGIYRLTPVCSESTEKIRSREWIRIGKIEKSLFIWSDGSNRTCHNVKPWTRTGRCKFYNLVTVHQSLILLWNGECFDPLFWYRRMC